MSLSENQLASKTESNSSQPAGLAFSKLGLIIGLVILVIAAWFGQIPIVILFSLLMGSAILTRLWSRYSLVGVSCQRILSQQRVFPGEQVELKLRVQNRKLLPLPWLQLDDEVPLRFTPDASAAEGNRPGSGFLGKTVALLWYTGASWHHRLDCDKRGYYQLGPITVTSGDIFGFYSRSAVQPLVDHILVYPRMFPIARLGIPSVYPLGETRAERRIFEDPARTIGVRDYNPCDSLRRVHWKASARHQQLKSKVYEPTTTLKVALFLAIDSFPNVGLRGDEEFELGISAAASIASHLSEQDSPVGLFVNTRQADSGQPVLIPPGSSTDHLVAVLEALAKVTAQASSPFEEFLESERGGFPWGTTLIFILSQPSESLRGIFASLKESGYKLLVIQIGDEAGKMEGVAWYNIGQHTDMVKLGSGEDL